MAETADTQTSAIHPSRTGMYELEFPAPQLSSADGSWAGDDHALEGLFGRRARHPAVRRASEEHP